MASLKGKNNPRYKTGLCMGKDGKSSGLYNSWQNMKGRCLRQTHPKYERYGGRGIKICNEWLGIEGFYKWAMANGWEPGLSLDRIDNDGNYCPENCQWVTMSANSRKKSTTKLTREQAENIRNLAAQGVDDEVIARSFGVTAGNIWFIKKGYTHVASGECTQMLQSRH
tara:strand:- start:2383 stop:2886 length:504 start_codon:yes stop_codon:yes gene_type:complete